MTKLTSFVMAGARLSQPYIPFRENRKIESCLCLSDFSKMHFAILAGADKEYADKLREFFTERNITNATVFNYVEDIPGLMEQAI